MDSIQLNQPLDLTATERDQLEKQNQRLVSEYKALDLEKNAQKYWDLFYKRNETKFFKDRHWTTREFCELIGDSTERKTIFEIGCGVGNFIYPLLEEGHNLQFITCDLSPRAIEFVKQHELFNENAIKAFQADVTDANIIETVGKSVVDIATMIFVLSAIHPDKFQGSLQNVFNVLKPGGFLIFRDYGLYDMAQLRFKAGHKIADNFYMRQDGTRSYYFSLEELESLAKNVGFVIKELYYVQRRTINKKENVDVPRTFIQAKFCKPAEAT